MLRRAAVQLILVSAFTSASASFAHAQDPAILRHVRVDPNRLVDFHAAVTPETLFVGQQATYQVAVLLDEATGSRLPRNPEYLPPELRGMLSYDLGGQQRFTYDANDKHYTAYVFQKALFPLAVGTFTVPAPQLTYALRQSSSYFSREESHTVRAESVTVVVRPLPVENRPADFTGAVGVLSASVRLDAASARVGDPLVLTLRVQGSGNIKLFPRPPLEIEWATAVAGTERLQMDTSGTVVRGTKEFDWILTPAREGDVTTPVIRYSYFNSNKREYDVADAAPITVAVAPGSLAKNEAGEKSTAALPLRGHDVGVVRSPLILRWQLWMLLALVPLPAVVLWLLGVPRPAAKPPAIDALRNMVQHTVVRPTHSPGQTITAPPSNARDVRRLLLTSLSRRLNVSTDVLTDRRRTRRVLRRRGVTPETADSVVLQLGALDLASFAASRRESEAETAALSRQALDVFDRVDNEAIGHARGATPRHRRGGHVAGFIVALLLVGSAGTHLLAQSTVPEWNDAVRAYGNRQFLVAANAFEQLSQRSPRNADLLTNWGAAAWAAGDTVGAVIAWQRAVRLDPLAADLREHLLLLPSGARDGVADVPLIPVTALGVLGVLCWVAGWVLAAWLFLRKRRRQELQPLLNATVVTLLLVGSMSALTSAWGAEQLNIDSLAVVLRPETLRSSPGADADAQGGAATGDVVRVDDARSDWVQVEHADGRVGWLPADRVAFLSNTTGR